MNRYILTATRSIHAAALAVEGFFIAISNTVEDIAARLHGAAIKAAIERFDNKVAAAADTAVKHGNLLARIRQLQNEAWATFHRLADQRDNFIAAAHAELEELGLLGDDTTVDLTDDTAAAPAA